MSLDDVDILELKDRYSFLIEKYANLAIEIAPKLDKMGKYRKELQLLVAEFSKRGAVISSPEGLEELIKEELAKRNSPVDENPGQREGEPVSEQSPVEHDQGLHQGELG